MNLKKFFAFENSPPIYYRDNTSDVAIINSVIVEKTEYMFPRFSPKMIWDIGANIGVVSHLFSHIYPEALIYAFEPQKENFSILETNSSPFEKVKIFNAGLGDRTHTVTGWHSDDEKNHGGFSVKIHSEKDTEAIQIIKTRDMIERLGVPELIKIDTEGSEDAILGSFKDSELSQIKWIAGELHGVNDFLLLDRLEKHFYLKLARNFGDKNWHFHAANKNWTDFS